MEYNGYTYSDKVTILHFGNDDITRLGDIAITKRQIDSSESYLTRLTRDQGELIKTEVKNSEFIIECLRHYCGNKLGRGTHLWECKVTHKETGISIITAVPTKSILNIMKHATVVNGKIDNAIAVYADGVLHFVIMDTPEYTDVMADYDLKKKISSKKTSNWQYGHTYDTIHESAIYLGTINQLLTTKFDDNGSNLNIIVPCEGTCRNIVVHRTFGNNDIESMTGLLGRWKQVCDTAIEKMSIKLEKYKEAPELIDLSWDITIDNHAGNNIFSILSSCDPINSITRLCKTVKRHDGGGVIKTDIESTVLLREFRDYAIESVLKFTESYNIDKLGTDWLKLIYRSETESSTVLNDNERKLLEYIYNYCSWSKNITDKAHVTYDGTYLLSLF